MTKLADEESDAHWAARAANLTPGDLARLNRRHEKPTVEESQARYAARNVRMWWEADRGMLQVRGELPDVLGAKFEATMKQLTERMRPPKGQPWEPWNRRAADALGLMCDAVAVAETVESPQLSPRPLFAVDVPFDGPAEVVGIPLPDAMLELRGQASIEPVLVDDDGIAIGIGRRSSALSPKKIRAVLLRDGHCRCENCDLRYGLQVHHLRSRTWVAVMTSRTSPPSPASTIRC